MIIQTMESIMRFVSDVFFFLFMAVYLLAYFPLKCLKWKLFGKHKLTDSENAYNERIEQVCEMLDAWYVKDAVFNLLYSAARNKLNAVFDDLSMTKPEKDRAMKEVAAQNVRNSEPGSEYVFALGGRSECFLLQTFLRQTKYCLEPEPVLTWH